MKNEKGLLSGNTTLLILALLRDGDKYGYEMAEELARRSDQTFMLKEGTLYPLLHTLEKDKLVVSYTKETESGRQRKYYRLTDEGRNQLTRKTEEWKLFSEKINAVIGVTPCLN